MKAAVGSDHPPGILAPNPHGSIRGHDPAHPIAVNAPGGKPEFARKSVGGSPLPKDEAHDNRGDDQSPDEDEAPPSATD